MSQGICKFCPWEGARLQMGLEISEERFYVGEILGVSKGGEKSFQSTVQGYSQCHVLVGFAGETEQMHKEELSGTV